jgi:hypothetical protein
MTNSIEISKDVSHLGLVLSFTRHKQSLPSSVRVRTTVKHSFPGSDRVCLPTCRLLYQQCDFRPDYTLYWRYATPTLELPVWDLLHLQQENLLHSDVLTAGYITDAVTMQSQHLRCL